MGNGYGDGEGEKQTNGFLSRNGHPQTYAADTRKHCLIKPSCKTTLCVVRLQFKRKSCLEQATVYGEGPFCF